MLSCPRGTFQIVTPKAKPSGGNLNVPQAHDNIDISPKKRVCGNNFITQDRN